MKYIVKFDQLICTFVQQDWTYSYKTFGITVFTLTPTCPKPGTSKTGFGQVKIMKEFV